MMRRLCGALLVLAISAPAEAGLENLARTGRWQQVLAVSLLRLDQLPLTPEEALVAAVAARHLGDGEAERLLLARASTSTTVAQVADIMLAELALEEEPERALRLVLPLLRSAQTRQLQAAAAGVASQTITSGVSNELIATLEQTVPHLPRSQRRTIELALALATQEGRRQRLDRLLTTSHRDLVALEAARALLSQPELTPQERWWIAQTLFRHALYDQAAGQLEGLLSTNDRHVPAWEVRFLRGRCAFRRGRWAEAGQWYLKALDHARHRDRCAYLQVHLARALELDGNLEEAIEHARRAVIIEADDDRRLFLARLRLKNHQPELAVKGISQLRWRTARGRGQILLALDELNREQTAAAIARLSRITVGSWRGPARVLAASLLAQEQEWEQVCQILETAAPRLDLYWGHAARELYKRLPDEVLKASRQRQERELGQASEGALLTALARWSTLEADPARLATISDAVLVNVGMPALDIDPSFDHQLGQRLWELGLEELAARWAPASFPDDGIAEVLWSAQRFAELQQPWRAISQGDAAWRMANGWISIRAYPPVLSRAVYPLPHPELVAAAASSARLPWSLLAGLVREESRWNHEVLSVVGARGLTQLMPSTAAGVASSHGEQPPSPDILFDPEVGLHLGALELGRLLQLYDGQHAPAVAAYNAGEVQASQWLAQCGPGCTEQRYILTISFEVTRDYTAKVLASAALYDDLYELGAPPGTTSDESTAAAALTGQTASPHGSPGLLQATARSQR